MLEKEIESRHEMESKRDSNSKSSVMVPWSFETNWIIAHGSLEDSVTIESSDYPITESDTDISARKSPLVLKPRRLDSRPCEITICFGKKYDIGQIYVRSTARVYEIYYAHSPHSSNEYLCTVRCDAAERDGKILQATGIEYVAEEHGDCLVGELTEDSVTDDRNIVSSDDDWVKIKVPEIGRSSLSDKTKINRVKNMQDLYEATAQISDADPCSYLTIRFLSLQDKGHAYVDEVYIFADLVESTDSGNEAVMAGSLTGSSLMAMLIPTLLPSAKSGVSRVLNNHASDEVLKDDKMETGLRIIDAESAKNQGDQQYVKLLDAAESAEFQQPTSSPNTEKLQELDKDTAELGELQQPTSALNKVPINLNDLLPGPLERGLEQLISRVSRVEDICLRFEEKMLKPIESIESRLQQLENQVEKLTKYSHCSDLPHGTRISAPAFSCSESNSSSFYNEGSDYPPGGASEFEKKNILCHNMPNLFRDAKFRPSLVVSAPEFSCGEDEEDNDDLEPLKDTSCIKPKQTLSVDDALAAALSGFMSTTKINPSERIQTISGPSSEVDEKTLHWETANFCQMEAQEFPTAENGRRESSQFSQILSIMAPDFTVEEIGEEEHSNYTQSSSDMASVFENKEKDRGDEMIPPSTQSKNLTSADSCDFNGNKSMRDFGSASNGVFCTVSDSPRRTCIVNLDLSDMSEIFGLNTVDSSFEEDISCECLEDRDLVETSNCQICDETNPRETCTVILDDKDSAIKQVLGLDSGCVSDVPQRCVAVERCFNDDTPNISESSRASMLDFEFPILEVEFTSGDYTSTKSPLEALLDGVAESNIEAHSIHDSVDYDGNAEQINVAIMDSNETADLLPSNYLLVDLGVSSADGSSNLEGVHNLCSPICPEIIVSLI